MRALVAFFALLWSGCATSGLAWVSAGDPSAVDDRSIGSVATTAPAMLSSVQQAPSAPSTNALESPAPAKPRLARTVTLGEIELGEAREVASGAPAAATPARGEQGVTIVYVQSPAVVYDPGYRRYSSGRSFQRAPRASQRASVRPHASSERDTPVKDYGPAFPFKAAPASPW